MKVVAITGGIGSGKSTVRRMFEELGASGIDADELARQVVAPGSEGARQLLEAFGPEFFDSGGNLDRKKMARKVFSQPEARIALESILHPLIRAAERSLLDQIERDQPESIAVVEVPLLTEVERSDDYCGVVLVTAPEATRIERLISSGLYDKEEAMARLANQARDREREKSADWIVDNSRSLKKTRKQVESIYMSIFGDL